MAYTDIDKSDEYFNTVLWTGNATDNRSITGVNFKPDLVWYKERSSTSWHNLQDVVRGTGKQIHSNSTEPETTNNGTIKAFETDGFQIGTEADINESSQTYVAWNWLANNTSGSSNTDGSITSTVSANTTSGFSIVSYTGNGSTNQTIGHGLGVEPSFIIVKARSTTMNWPTYSKALGNGVAFLDITDAWDGGPAYSNYWYISGMTSSTFGVSNNINTNTSGVTYIAYCFAEKKGFSKFNTYTGNGNADGTFVYTGFKPAFVLVKLSSGVDDWQILDNKRNTYNVMNEYLRPNSSGATTTNDVVDFVSNGFKHRSSLGSWNPSGGTFIYMAFAENPFVTSTGIPGLAR